MVWGFFPRLSLCTCFVKLTCGVVISCILPQVFRDEWVLHPAIWMLRNSYVPPGQEPCLQDVDVTWSHDSNHWIFNNFEPKTLNHPITFTIFKSCDSSGILVATLLSTGRSLVQHGTMTKNSFFSPFREGTWREDQIIWKNSRWKWSDLWHLKVLRWNNWKTMHRNV